MLPNVRISCVLIGWNSFLFSASLTNPHSPASVKCRAGGHAADFCELWLTPAADDPFVWTRSETEDEKSGALPNRPVDKDSSAVDLVIFCSACNASAHTAS